jgi:hypothetical protein
MRVFPISTGSQFGERHRIASLKNSVSGTCLSYIICVRLRVALHRMLVENIRKILLTGSELGIVPESRVRIESIKMEENSDFQRASGRAL